MQGTESESVNVFGSCESLVPEDIVGDRSGRLAEAKTLVIVQFLECEWYGNSIRKKKRVELVFLSWCTRLEYSLVQF